MIRFFVNFFLLFSFSFTLAHAENFEQDFENQVRSMFDTSPNMIPDLQVQLTKAVSKGMMVSEVSDFKTITNMASCQKAIDLVEGFDKSDYLEIKKYNQLYEDVFQESDVDRSDLFKETFGEESFYEFAYCMYQIGKSYGTISSLNNVFYKPIINLQTGQVEEELTQEIAEELVKGIRR